MESIKSKDATIAGLEGACEKLTEQRNRLLEAVKVVQGLTDNEAILRIIREAIQSVEGGEQSCLS